jgi:N-acetylglucosamine malate deacetylase 1
MKRILVISPHPDDESIGCGGTLCHHTQQGDEIQVVFLTSGEKGGHGRSQADTIRLREKEARRAAEILQIKNLEFWREPDGGISANRRSVTRLQNKLQDSCPDLIYIPHDREMHRDHIGAVRLLKAALRRTNRLKPEVLMFEVWTPIQRLDAIVDISAYMETKLKAVRVYRSQCEVMDFPEAVRGLNRYRGEMHSWPGGDYAEVFSRLRL